MFYKPFLQYLFLLLVTDLALGNFNECTFEKDDCGWFSGASIGVGSWRRVTTKELEDEGVDVHPASDASGDKTGNIITFIHFT